MDNPGSSIFQGADINLNNSQNNEEEEDLEDQRRRNEELQNLLKSKLDDFNYDESTMNSSTNISVVSLDELQNKYRDAADPNDQLKVLYDVRLREINSLREEYDKYKSEMIREIDVYKNKLFISEAEMQQLKISLRNAEELLVEKTSSINELKSTLNRREEEIRNFEKTVENLRLEIGTYQTTIQDLETTHQADSNPFNLGAKKFSSDEQKMAHQQQIVRLESLLEEQMQTTKTFEKQKLVLQEQLHHLVDIEKDDKNTIDALTKNFESAQRQCEELIEVIEMLTKENRHLQNRVNNGYQNSLEETNNITNSFGNKTLEGHVEKLKKMLVDKSVQMDSLNSKLKNYENNIRELLEYRELKSDIFKKEFQECNNKEHTKTLLVMQNDLQNYKRTLEDKNHQILNLNSTNKDLLQKMEEMLSQTRNEIKNFSYKYSLPQLEKMVEDLKNAEARIKELEESLAKSEERRLSLTQKLQKSNKNAEQDLKKEMVVLETNTEKERMHFENQLKKLQKEIEVSSAEIKSLKQYTEDLINENTSLKSELKMANSHIKAACEEPANLKTVNPDEEALKKQYLEAIQKLHEAQNKIKAQEETLEEMTNAKTIAEGEKCTLQYQLRDYENHLENAQKYINDLENKLLAFSKINRDNETIINSLQDNPPENALEEIRKELSCKEDALKICVADKNELMELLQKANLQLEETKQEVLNLQNQVAEMTEKMTRRNLEKELKEAENYVEQIKNDNGASNLNMDLQLREAIQQEYLQKLKEIEMKYQKACSSSSDLYREQVEKMKNHEVRYREQLATILAECAKKMKEVEGDRQHLIKQIDTLQREFDEYKVKAAISEKSLKKLIRDAQREGEENVDNWKKWSKTFVSDCLAIEKTNKTSRDNVLHTMKTFDYEVATVEKAYNEKIRKYVKNCKIKM